MKKVAIILVVLGILFLLRNFGINVWGLSDIVRFIFKLWPLALIYIGYEMYKEHSSKSEKVTGLLSNDKIKPKEKEKSYKLKEEHTQKKNKETSLSVSIVDTIGDLLFAKAQEPETLFHYKSAYNDQKIFKYDYTSKKKGDLTITNSFRGEQLFSQLKERGFLSLEVSKHIPIEVYMKTGIGSSQMDFSDLRVKKLDIHTGASKLNVVFNSPNQEQMEEFDVSSGATVLHMEKLLNANFAKMQFDGGAGKYYLDFSGELQRSAKVMMHCGASKVKLVIPSDVPACIKIFSTMTHIQNLGGFTMVEEGVYQNDNYRIASGHKLDLEIESGISNLIIN